MLVMGALPGAGAAAVRRRKTTAQGARQRLDGTYVMKADGRALVRREGVAALGENVDTASAVTATVPTARLAKVVKESHDSDTVGREPARVVSSTAETRKSFFRSVRFCIIGCRFMFSKKNLENPKSVRFYTMNLK